MADNQLNGSVRMVSLVYGAMDGALIEVRESVIRDGGGNLLVKNPETGVAYRYRIAEKDQFKAYARGPA